MNLNCLEVAFSSLDICLNIFKSKKKEFFRQLSSIVSCWWRLRQSSQFIIVFLFEIFFSLFFFSCNLFWIRIDLFLFNIFSLLSMRNSYYTPNTKPCIIFFAILGFQNFFYSHFKTLFIYFCFQVLRTAHWFATAL